MFDYAAYRALVKQKRGALRLSQENLANDALGDPTRKAEISRIETGKTNPQEATIQKINEVLGISEAEMAPSRQSRVTAKDLDNLSALDRDDLELLATRFQIADAPDLPIRQLRDLLHDKAKEFRTLVKEVDELKNVAPRLANQHAAAMDALANLRIEEAEEILANAREVVTEQLRDPLEINAQLMEAQAAAALSRGDVEQAYTLLSAAADSFAAVDPLEPVNRKHAYMQRLYYHGLRFGGSGIWKAVEMIEEAIRNCKEGSELWAKCKNAEALALRDQGIRTAGDDGTLLLRDAVAACYAALTVYNENSHPVSWATVQNNLGNALSDQGTRLAGEDGTRLLADAVTAYRRALTVRTKFDHPVNWATTQSNLGAALHDQGIRNPDEGGIHLLIEAVTAFRAALTIRTETAHPVQWASSQYNLGIALTNQGSRTAGIEGIRLMKEAITAFRAALTIRTGADHPVDWAATQVNLAIAEEGIADHDTTKDPRPHLEAALAHIEAALTVFDPEHMSHQFEKATRLRDDLKARLAELD